MYYLLSLLVGIIISVMIFLNGKLTAGYGAYWAAVIIHIVGVVFAGTVCVIKKTKIRAHAPLWAYMGGAFGVLTTIFSNYAFGRIDMTSIVALGLLGQSLLSVTLDSFGWLGMKKQRPGKYSVIGYLAAAIGIFVMINKNPSGAVFAVVLSLCSGATTVLSRTINARLSMETGPIAGSFINHLVGLPICIVLSLLLQQPFTMSVSGSSPFIYLGGVLGVVTVLLFNITVPKVSAFRLTLLSFVGQIFMGIFLDIVFGGEYSASTFTGGIIIAVGLLINMLMESWDNGKSTKKNVEKLL